MLMNIVSKAISVSVILFSGLWTVSAFAYDNNLYHKASKLEKESWSLSKNLYRLHGSRDSVSNARNLAHAARSLKGSVKNNNSRDVIHRKFTTVQVRYDQLMRFLGYRDYRGYGHRERHVDQHIRKVQDSFQAAFRAFGGRGYNYDRRGDPRYNPNKYY